MTLKHEVNCLHEDDFKRWRRIIDGNGDKALIVRLTNIEMNIEQTMEVSKANATAVNGVRRFMDDIQTRDQLIEKMEKRERDMKKWRIATAIAFLGIVVTIGLFVIEILSKLPS